MKHCLFLLLLSLCIAQVVCAQAPLVKMWDKRFGGTDEDELRSFQQTIDGGYILGGTSFSSSGGDKTQDRWGYSDYWVVKIDSMGNKQWDKRFGGFGNNELVTVQQTNDEGYILGGRSDSYASGDKTQDAWVRIGGGTVFTLDYWIVKIDPLGNKQWDKRFGTHEADWLTTVQQTRDGGYILGGYTKAGVSHDKSQPSWGSDDFWVVKINSLGDKQWDKRFGGYGSDQLFALDQTFDGGYILGGESISESAGDKSQNNWFLPYTDYWIVKIDSLGNKQWDKRFGSLGEDNLRSLQSTSDAGYILCGYSNGTGGDRTEFNEGYLDYWIVKIDFFGNKEWDKSFGGSSSDWATLISQTVDGGYLVTGNSSSPASGDKSENNLGSIQLWIIKTGAYGVRQWDKTINTNGSENAYPKIYGIYGGIPLSDTCYVIAAGTTSGIGGYKTQPNWDTTNTSTDFWIVKFCDTSTVSSFILDNSFNKITLHPNPTNNTITLTASAIQTPATLTLVDALGKAVLQQSAQPQELSKGIVLDMRALPEGIYFLRVFTAGGSRVMKVVRY